jgi:DNA-binding NarL/FixJ family response regulator
MLKILIVDDQEYIRRGLRALLSEETDIQVCGEAGDGWDAVDLVHKLRPDVVIMDISMPILDGLQATREIRQLFPRVRVVTVSQYELDDNLNESLSAGALAHVPKTAVWEHLIPTIRSLPLDGRN